MIRSKLPSLPLIVAGLHRFHKSNIRMCSSIVLNQFGNPLEVLEHCACKSFDSASVYAGQVGVDMVSVSLSNLDLHKVYGKSLGSHRGTIGQSGLATVRAVGDGVAGVAIKDKVFVHSPKGICTTHTVVSATEVVPLGSAGSILSPEQAALVPLVAAAHSMLVHTPSHSRTDRQSQPQPLLAPGDSVILDAQAAQSPMGSVLKQVAAELGIKIVVHTAGAKEKARLVLCGDGRQSTMKEMLKTVAEDGTLLCFDSNADTNGSNFTSFKIPYSSAIFSNVCIAGFDFSALAIICPDSWRRSVELAVGLVTRTQVHLQIERVPLADIKSILALISASSSSVVAVKI